MTNPQKTINGITLIALIITIIVMLILVSVAVRASINSGLFGHAGNATKRWSDEQRKESNISNGEIEINGKKYSSVDEYLEAENLEKLVENAKKHPEQSEENGDIGIGTDGKPVNLDLWRYTLESNQTYRLSVGKIGNKENPMSNGYIGPLTETGEIVGKMPQYIIDKETGKAFPVTDMTGTFWKTDIEIAPEIPETISRINDGAFASCKKLTTVNIPNTIDSIEEEAFSGCESLTSINIPDSVKNIGTMAFAGSGLTSIDIPGSVSTIGDAAFYYCPILTVTIAAGVRSLGEGAFHNCVQLTEIHIPDSVTTIGSGAFAFCDALKSANIPEGLTTIAMGTFQACNSLESITIPSSVTKVDYGAFMHCNTLKNIKISSNLIEIKGRAFAGRSIESFEVDPDNPNYTTVDGVLYNKSKTKIVQHPGGKKGIYEIPSSVTIIGEGAFYYYSANSITIPNSVTNIEGEAFCNTNLSNIRIPSSVTDVGEVAFHSSKMASIEVDANNPNYSSVDGVLFNKAGTKLLEFPMAKSGPYEFPSGVIAIGSFAFCDSKNISSINIPRTIATIEELAFYNWWYNTTIKTINCQITAKPSGWNENWCDLKGTTINWGATM